MTRLFIAALVALTTACGDNVAGDEVGGDQLSLSVGTPTRGARGATSELQVTGDASGPVERVEVNGSRVSINPDGSFSAPLQLPLGTHLIETVAIGGSQSVRDVRSVSVGDFADTTVAIESGLRVQLGAMGLFGAAAAISAAVDSAAVEAALVGQVIVDRGTEAGCDLDRITVTTASAPVSSVAIVANVDGFSGETTHNPFTFGLSVQYSHSTCAVVTADVGFVTEEIHVEYEIDPGLAAGVFAATAVVPASPLDHEIVIDDSNLDPAVAARVTSGLALALAERVISIAIPRVNTSTTEWLNQFSRVRAPVAVAGVEIAVAATPTELVANADGLLIDFSRESSSNAERAGYVATPTDPIPQASTYASVSIADDSIDSALGAVWGAGGFGEILVPPSVQVNSDGVMIVFGDLVVGDTGAQSVVFGRAQLEAENASGELSLRISDFRADSLPLAGGADSVRVDAATSELRGHIEEVLATFSQPVGALAWPAVELVATGGYLRIDTQQ